MFVEYRADPGQTRAELAGRLAELEQQSSEDTERPDFDDPLTNEFFQEMYGPPSEARQRMGAELKDLEQVHTEEEMILYRLGLAPALPVRKESLQRLATRYASAYEVFKQGWDEMDARLQELRQQHQQRSVGLLHRLLGAKASSGSGEDDMLAWLRSPTMKAKRELDEQIGELLRLRAHLWIAKRLLQDEAGTLAMFRRRCPRCKAEGLRVEAYQT